MAAVKGSRRLSRTARVSLIAGGGLVALLAGSYAAGYAMAGDDLPRSASVAGVQIGGMTAAQADTKLRAELGQRSTEPITVTAGEASVTVEPSELGFGIDYAASIAQAGGGRTTNPIGIIQVLFGGAEMEAVTSHDDQAIADLVTSLGEKVDGAPVNAKLAYVKGEPKVTPGGDGLALEPEAAAEQIVAAFLHQTRIELEVAASEPDITTAEAQQVADTLATPALASSIRVEVGGHGTVVLEPEVIAETLTFVEKDGSLVPSFDAKKLSSQLQGELNGLGLKAPRNASFTIKKGGKPKIVASKDGLGIDTDELSSQLAAVVSQGSNREVSVGTAARPASFTTEDAKAAGVKQVTGKFTTYFPGSAYRYNNIGKAAKLINGTYLAPGETFSMNQTLGERTAKAGWMRGGGIANGRIDPNIYGGGISQATTTTFNAIFFAGLEDIYHKPHSLYFSRYPIGREATLDWKSVDMKFKNDSDHGVLLQAWITGRTGSQGSITVQVWSTKTWTIKSTKPVTSNYRAPGKTIYNDKAGCVAQSAMSGFDATYYREFYRSKKLVKKEKFTWAYNALTPVVCGKDPSKKKA